MKCSNLRSRHNAFSLSSNLCIRALGISAGDEVIVPSFTFVAAANAIRYEGAVPVFADIESRYLNIDPNRIESFISPRTRAIIAVHTFGCPADMDAILDIANRHQLRVIEDACEALGATCRVGMWALSVTLRYSRSTPTNK
jgi:perosamine synthetase